MSWRRILLFSIALVAVLTATTWGLLQNSNVATDFIRRELQTVFATPIEIGDTAIDLEAGRLSLEGVRLADPTNAKRAIARFRSGKVDVQFDPLGAGIAPRYAVFEGLEVEAGPHFPTTSQLLRQGSKPAPSKQRAIALPVIEIVGGKVTLYLTDGARPLQLNDIDLNVAPLEDDPAIVRVNGSARLLEPPATLTINGEVNLASGAAVVSVATADVTCTEQMVTDLAHLARIEQPELRVGGEIKLLRVTCHLPPHDVTPRTPTFEVEANCSDIELNTPKLPPIVRRADVQFYLDTANRGRIEATVQQRNESGEIDICARVTELDAADPARPRFELRAKGKRVVINEDVRAALQTFKVGQRVITGLAPTAGLADIDLYLRNPHIPDQGVVEMDLELQDVAMSFHGFGEQERRIAFPLPLEHGRGSVKLRDKILTLRDVRADIAAPAGGGEVSLRGRVNVARGRGDDTSLDIEGDGVAFQDDLRSAIATLLRDDGALYDKLAPQGRADVRVAVRPRALLPGGFDVTILPRGAAMRWEGFPYRLDDLQGSIRVRKAQANFDLRGRHGSGGLAMRGRIPTSKEHSPEDGFEAVVELDQLTIDEDLRAGISAVIPELVDDWQRASPTGTLSGAVKVWRPGPDAALSHDVRLQLDEVELDLPLPPWRATSLSGPVLIQGAGSDARVDFDAVIGELRSGASTSAKLALLGHLQTGPEVARDLAFVIQGLELNEQLGQSLDELNALQRETWTSLQPAGQVDLTVRERFEGASGPDRSLDLVVQLIDVRSNAKMLPRPAEQMAGELFIKDGELSFGEIRAQLGDASVKCSDGRIRQLDDPDGRTEIIFDVHARDFPVDDGLANLFTGPLRDAILKRELSGEADVDGLRLQFRLPTPGNELPFVTTIGGSINLDGVDLLLGSGKDGLRINDLNGQVALAESTVNEDGGGLRGTLSGGAMTLLGHTLEAVGGRFTADAEQIQIHTINARLHDGELRHARPEGPAIDYMMPAATYPEGRLAGHLQFDRVDVFSLLSASGWRNPPYRGFASGELNLLHLDGNNLVGAEATGAIQVKRADLGKVPLFTAIYAQLPAADQPRFNELDLQFRLTEEAMQFDRLNVRSDILGVEGKGRLDLDGYLDVQMELANLLGASADPLVRPLIDYLAKNLVSFRLYGHLRDLRASTEFLGSRAPKRRKVQPMPPTRKQPKTPGY